MTHEASECVKVTRRGELAANQKPSALGSKRQNSILHSPSFAHRLLSTQAQELAS